MRKKICFVTASPMTLRLFMKNHIRCLVDRYDITAIANFSIQDLNEEWIPGVRLVSIPIEREIDLFSDFIALFSLVRFLRAEHFDVVHSITPKAGLLAMTASRLLSIPVRIHNLSGQVWATKRGFYRFLLKSADRITLKNATRLLSDSASQTDFLVAEGLVSAERVQMLGRGSISGVDGTRFSVNFAFRTSVRGSLNIPQDSLLILFVGRLNRDKGVLDLARAFDQLRVVRKDVWLVVVGNDESNIEGEFSQLCGKAQPYVRRVAHTEMPEQYMAAADIFVLPSYRESFGLTVIEAAACAVPAVTSRIYGLTDAVAENITGLMHPPGDVLALVGCLELLCNDSNLRRIMGGAARERAHSEFSMQAVTAAFVTYYDALPGIARTC